MRFILLCAMLLVLNYCSTEKNTYGVLLYPKDIDDVPVGSVIQIIEKRDEYDTFEKKTIISFYYKGQTYECPGPFILSFDSQQGAELFSKKYRTYRSAFGEVRASGLRLRDKPETYSQIKHRLTIREVVKIISRTKKLDEADGEKDYWYFVLTQDGERGYCFGHYLEIHENNYWKMSEREKHYKSKREEIPQTYPLLQNIFSATWRPYYVYEQIQTGELDPNIIKEDLSISFNEDKRMIKIKMSGINFETHYYKIKRKDYNTYVFWDSSVVVERIDNRHINVSFKYNGNVIKQRYIKLPVSLKQIIKEEKKQQKEALQNMLKQSNHFTSEAYGSLVIDKDGTFFWETTPLLQSHVTHVSGNIGGYIDCTITLSTELQEQYDGGLLLEYNKRNNIQDTIYFLYNNLKTGLQLTYIPKDYVTRNTIQELPLSPLVMFFKHSMNIGKDALANKDITKL